MHAPADAQIQHALQLHRRGSLDEAKSIYQRLLSENPSNADAIGLLAMIAFQEGKTSEAESLWKKALGLKAAPSVHIRDMNNLVTTLLDEGRDDEARSWLASSDIPKWVGHQAPDPRELKSLMSLVLCLIRLDLPRKARTLLESIYPFLTREKAALRLLAQLRMDDEDFATALEALNSFEDTDDLWVLSARLKCARIAASQDKVKAHREALLRSASICVDENFREDRPTILVVNSSDNTPATESLFDLHFYSNYPTQLARRMKDRFNFMSVFPESPYLNREALRPDILLNNVVNGEALSGAAGGTLKEDLAAFVDALGAPVINHPLRAAMTTRQRMAVALKELTNVVVPSTIRFIARNDEIDFQVRALEEQLNYPLILRTTTFQAGLGMAKIANAFELRGELSARNGRELYAHNFVENRGEDGWYRKFRAGVVGDEIIPHWVDFSDQWNVHGRASSERKAFYRQRQYLRDVERRVLTTPNDILSQDVLETLADIRKKVPLDIFGIDFDVMPDGRVLFFEANACMLLFGPPGPEDADIRRYDQPSDRLQSAIVEYLQSRNRRSSASRLQ